MVAVTQTGRLIAGRYRLQAAIGRGAMGVVWRGRDELLHRDVAVKEVRITPLTAAGEAAVAYQRTLREARTAGRLSHPSVVTVFDVVEEHGSPWIVMELVRGRSLDQVIAEDGPLPPLHAAQLGTSLLGALATAHAAGVLHRDVKPGNVLLTADGRAVLTDFGIATFEEDPGLTQAGMVVGTPGFTAPERVRGRGATPASDLWSLGATLYAAVEGRGPFDRAGGATAISAGVVREDAPRAPSAGPLGPVIDALLRPDPVTRPDAATAATLLASAAAGSGPRRRPDPGWRAGRQAAVAGPDDAAAALPARPGPGLPGRAPAFHDPPVFADLRMPGPADGRAGQTAGLPEFLNPPGAAAAGVPGPAGPARAGPARAGPAQAGQAQAGQAGTPSPAARRGPWSRYWRVATAGAGIAAIAAAAALGFKLYSHSLTAGGQPAGTGAARGAAGTAAVAGRSARPGSGTRVSPGRAGAAGHGSARDSVTAGAGSSGGIAAPAGYQWHRVTAGSLGTAAGFVIAAPDAWQLRTRGRAAYLDAPGGRANIEISLSPFTYYPPVREARYQQAAAIAAGEYPGYRPVAILPARFRGAAAASWRFTWKQAGAGRTAVLAVLATLPTPAGSQSYALSVSAPAASAAAARSVFATALPTFRPLPPA